MTTSPVTSVTDELIAELESYHSAINDPLEFGDGTVRRSKAIIALLAERAELKLDAERLEWMIAEQCIMRVQNGTGLPHVYSLWWSTLSEGQREWYPSAREAIDAAMQP